MHQLLADYVTWANAGTESEYARSILEGKPMGEM
jgi:hypothetical protein